MHVEGAWATLHFSISLISLRVEVERISDFLVHAKILPFGKAFFNLNLPHSRVVSRAGLLGSGSGFGPGSGPKLIKIRA